MSLTIGLQLSTGIQPVNPIPVDSWSGPYTGSTLREALDIALLAIFIEVRFPTMEVRIRVGNTGYKYWFKDGIANDNLVEFSTSVFTQAQSNWNETNSTLSAYIQNKPSIYSFTGDSSQYTKGDGTYATFPSFVTALSSLTDVNFSTLANRNLLFYDSTSLKWINSNITNSDLPEITGVSGTYGDNQNIPQITINSKGLITSVSSLSIPQANTTTTGLITSTDWNTFNGKQTALNGTGFVKISGTTISYDNSTYLTTIDGITAGGELSGTYANPSLANNAVIGKVLTGLSVIGASIISTDTILSAFGKIQNQLNTVAGAMLYEGVWNATSNTPTLTSSVGTKGYIYKVTTSGTTNLDGITDWKVGDFAVFNGTTWDKWDSTDAITSINGYTSGTVVLTTSDIEEGTKLYYTDTRARNSISNSITGITYNSSDGLFSLLSDYVIPTVIEEINWNTAFSQTRQWNGGATGLIAATGRTSLGLVIGTDVLAQRTFGSAANSSTEDFYSSTNPSNYIDNTTSGLTNYYTKIVSDSNYKPFGYKPTLDDIVANGYNVAQKIIVFRSYTGDIAASNLEYKHQFNDGTKSKLQVSLAPYDSAFNFTNQEGDAVITLTKEGTNSRIQDIHFYNATGGKVYYNLSEVLTVVAGDARYIKPANSIPTSELSGTYANPTLVNSAVIGKVLTGYVSGAGTILATDNILQAIQKLNGNISGIVSGVSSVFGRTGTVVATTGDYTTAQVTEGTNKYYTDTRTRAAISLTATGTSGAAAYNNTTGILNIPTYTLSGLGGYPLTGGDLSTGAYLGLPAISQPTTPATGLLKLYSDVSGRLTWLSSLGYTRTLRSISLTANRLYTLQDRDGTLADDTDLAGKQPLATNLTSLGGLTYTSLGFVKMSASGTFSLDTTTYLTSPLTTKGDLLTYSTTNARLAIGTDNYVLTVDSTQATGLKWAAISPGVSSITLTTSGILHTTPTTFTNTSGAWSATQTLASQSANLILASPNGSAGTPTFRQILNADITTGTIDLTTKVTGILPIANGGTGSSTQNWVDLTTSQTIAGAKTFTGITSITSVTPELRLTTSDTLYSRFQRNTTNNSTYFKANVFQPGGTGNAITLGGTRSGTYSYGSVSFAGVTPKTTGFTVSCWVKGMASTVAGITGNGDLTPIFTIGPGGGDPANITIGVQNISGYKIIFGDSYYGSINYTIPTIDNTTWYHLVGTYSSAGVFTLYVNGVSIGTYSNAAFTSSTNFYLGGAYTGRNGMFNGQIDQLLIYNRVLTTTSGAGSSNEITAIYNGNGTATPPTTGLVRRYDFESITGATTPDTNGSTAYDLALYNSPTLVGPGNGKVPVSGASSEGTGWEYSDGLNSNERGSFYAGDVYGGTYMRGYTVKALINASLYPFIINSNGKILISATNTSTSAVGLSDLSVVGGLAIGSYATANTAPTNGLIVSGTSGFGTASPSSSYIMDVVGTSRFTGIQTIYGSTPEMWIQTSGDSLKSRIVRSTVLSNNALNFYNNVNQVGGIGNALNLTSTSQYFQAVDTGLSITTFSVSCWFKTSDSTSNHNIWSYGLTGGAYPFDFVISSSGNCKAQWSSSGNNSITGTFNISAWNHAVITSTGSIVSLYINGSFISSLTSSTGLALNGILNIGNSQNSLGGTPSFIGQVDQFLYYNTVLTLAQIGYIYNSGTGTSTLGTGTGTTGQLPLTGLIRRYEFEEGAGTVVADTNPNGTQYNGVLYNSPSWAGVSNGKVPTVASSTEGNFLNYIDGQNSNERGQLNIGDVISGTVLRGISVKTLINGLTYPFIQDVTGKVLISPLNTSASATATYDLDVVGTIRATTLLKSDGTLQINSASTSSQAHIDSTIKTTALFATNTQSIGSTLISGLYGQTNITNTSTPTITSLNDTTGTTGVLYLNNTGNIALWSGSNQENLAVSGVKGVVYGVNTGNVTANIITSFIANQYFTSSGSYDHVAGMRVGVPTTGPGLAAYTGTITTYSGIYINDITASPITARVTNQYAINQVGANDIVYLNGRVRVGSSTDVLAGTRLQVTGGFYTDSLNAAIITVTTNTTLTSAHHTILVDATSGNLTITIPAATGHKRIYVIKKIDSTANIVTVSGVNIDTVSSKLISTQNSGFVIQSNSTQYYLISNF